LATILVYAQTQELAYELIRAVHAIGDEVIALAINDEALAVDLARRGVKVLAITGRDLAIADITTIVWALKHAIDKTRASTIFLASNRFLNEVARRLSNINDSKCLYNIDYLWSREEHIVCYRNSSLGSDINVIDTIEIDKHGAILTLSPHIYPPVPECGGGSIEDIKLNLPPAQKLAGAKIYSIDNFLEMSIKLVAEGI
jgi:electron transfer flavoprotein alpha subunit